MKLDLEAWKINNFENELQFQCKAIELISYFFPKLRGLVYHPKNEVVIERKLDEIISPNDSELTKNRKNSLYNDRCSRMRNRWIAEGMLPGNPDIGIMYHGIRYPIELKQPKGRTSPEQNKVHERWNEDCPNIPIQLAYNLYHVYMYCKWIIAMDLHIDFNSCKGGGSMSLFNGSSFEPFKL